MKIYILSEKVNYDLKSVSHRIVLRKQFNYVAEAAEVGNALEFRVSDWECLFDSFVGFFVRSYAQRKHGSCYYRK